MCKKLFIFIGLFVLLFGFNLNVYAVETKPSFSFSLDSKEARLLAKSICTDIVYNGQVSNPKYCWYHDKINDKWIQDFGIIDFEKTSVTSIDKFGISAIANINDLMTYLNGLKCTKDDGDVIECYQYVALSYCGNNTERFTKTSDQVCQELSKLDGQTNDVKIAKKKSNGENYVYRPCNVTFKAVGKEISDIFELRMVWYEYNNFFDATVDENSFTLAIIGKERGRVSSTKSDTNNHFYLYSKSTSNSSIKSYDDFLKLMKSKVSAGVCSSKELGVLCLGNNKSSYHGDEFNWYYEENEDNCTTENGYIEDVSQTVGNDSDNSEIEYTDLAEKLINYAESMVVKGNGLKEFASCDDLLAGGKNSIVNILKVVVNIIKFIVPVMFVVLGSMDFIQAIFAQDDGGMKKAQTRFIKRLIVAVVIFLVPYALRLVLTVANGIWPFISPDFCGIL